MKTYIEPSIKVREFSETDGIMAASVNGEADGSLPVSTNEITDGNQIGVKWHNNIWDDEEEE